MIVWLLFLVPIITYALHKMHQMKKKHICETVQKAAKDRDFKVCVVGAGLGGLGVGLTLQEMGIDFTIIEKSADVGGTWLDNTYPGIGCDVSSHLYSFSQVMNPLWSQAFSGGAEILEYVKKVAVPVKSKIRFNCMVVSATWKEELSKWTVKVDSGESMLVDVIITATGLLHTPHTASIEGADSFTGVKVHTNKWDNDISFLGKSVGVVGTGASAIQAVPEIAKFGVKSLTVFQRTAAWVSPRGNYFYYDVIQKLFVYVPFVHMLYRWALFWTYEVRFFIVFILANNDLPIIGKLHGFIQSMIHTIVRRHVRKVVKDPQTAENLIPKYPLGCKRITPSDAFLESFNRENVHLVVETIEKIDGSAVVTFDGKRHDLDILVYATGFDLIASVNAFQVTGITGKNLEEDHGDAPRAYYGITHHLCPNYFMVGGPGIVLGHTSILFIGECQLTYICSALETMLLKNLKSVVLKESSHEEYQKWSKKTMKNKVFQGAKFCTGWYRNSRGVNWTFWPTNVICFWWYTLGFDAENYDICKY